MRFTEILGDIKKTKKKWLWNWKHKREEVVGGFRKLHNEELHNLYASLNIIRVINQE